MKKRLKKKKYKKFILLCIKEQGKLRVFSELVNKGLWNVDNNPKNNYYKIKGNYNKEWEGIEL